MSTHEKYLLVDGHSVLFQLPEWRSLHQKNRSLAREKLSQLLQELQDTSEWLITVVYDGTKGSHQPPEPGKIAILYSTTDSTADSIIERIVAQNPTPERITVVTADRLEQTTIETLGAFCLSPEWLMQECESSSDQFHETLKDVHRKSQW